MSSRNGVVALAAVLLGGCPGGSDGAGGDPAEAPAATEPATSSGRDVQPPSSAPAAPRSDQPDPSASAPTAPAGETDHADGTDDVDEEKEAADAPPAPERADEGDCDQLERGLRSAVARARRCRDHDECVVVAIDAAVSPCPSSIHQDAPLAELREQAVRYRTTCNPPIRRVRCAHHPGAICQRGRCVPATAEQLDRAGVSVPDTPR